MEQKNFNDEIEIDVKELAYVLLKRFWIIAMAGIGLALAAFLLSKMVLTPMYRSTTTVYVLNKQEENSAITYADLQSGAQLTKDFMKLTVSRPVIEQVIAELGLELKYEQLVGAITVENPESTRLLYITVEYNDPFMAKQIADSVRAAAATQIQNVMDIEKVNTAEEANVPEAPSSPNTFRNTILGGLLGGFLAGFFILLFYILDDTLKTPDDIEKHLGVSVLSSIPIQDSLVKKKKKGRKSSKGKDANITETKSK